MTDNNQSPTDSTDVHPDTGEIKTLDPEAVSKVSGLPEPDYSDVRECPECAHDAPLLFEEDGPDRPAEYECKACGHRIIDDDENPLWQ